ncbi:MAG: hypothetical protein U0667_17270 [Chloroflexota bacterium]
MVTALGLLGYALLVLAAWMLSPVAGVAAAGAACLYLSYANWQPPRRD